MNRVVQEKSKSTIIITMMMTLTFHEDSFKDNCIDDKNIFNANLPSAQKTKNLRVLSFDIS